MDGVDCLRANDGTHSLLWLPMVLPSNVRIIFSAKMTNSELLSHREACFDTANERRYPQDDESSSANSTLQRSTIRELHRRCETVLAIEPIHHDTCRIIIKVMLFPSKREYSYR